MYYERGNNVNKLCIRSLLILVFNFFLVAILQSGSKAITLEMKDHYANKLIEQYKLDDKGSHASDTIVLAIEPHESVYYSHLQNKIATFIPEEAERPTIDVTIVAKGAKVLKSIGIFGGTGPISDSQLLDHIMQHADHIDWSKISINLFSCPPPRSLKQGLYHWNYMPKLKSMASRTHSNYYLASNTAHLHLKVMRYLVKFANSGDAKVVDLVDYVSQSVKNNKSNKDDISNVLVLGTLAGYQEKLYPGYLEGKHFVESSDNACKQDCYHTLRNKEQATELQSYIDMAKSGSIEKAGKLIAQFIIKELTFISKAGNKKGTMVNKILLGCTELPMALDAKLLNVIKENYKKSSRGSLEFINTEALFAEKILFDMQELTQTSDGNKATRKKIKN